MAISLGTVYGSVRLALAGLEDDAAAVRETLASIQGQFDQLVASTDASTQAIADAMAVPDVAAQELSASVADATAAMSEGMDAAAEATSNLAAASDEAAASVSASTDAIDANTAAVDANTASKDASSSSTNKLGKQFGALRMPLLAAGIAVAGIGIAALVVGSQYQTAMSQVQALTGQTAAQMAQFNTQVLTDAPKWGAAPKDLANGLYYILSAGVPASQAMGVLQVVTEASAAGLVNAATDADALTTSLNSYGAGANQAMHYQDLLLTSVKDGKQTMSDLASSIGKAASMGGALGISFDQVAAAESTMTLTGDSARMASMQLSSLMTVLDMKTDTLAKRAKKLGIAFDEQKFKTMDLHDQLIYLSDATGHNNAKLGQLINNSAASLGAFKLLTNGGTDFKNILDDMGKSSGMTATAFKVHEATMGASFDKLKASGEVALIHIQQALQPIVTAVVAHVLPALNRFSAWAATHGPELATDIKIVAIAFGITLVAALGAVTIAFIAANAAAIGISLAIMAISTAVAIVIVNWPKIVAFFQSTSAPALAVKAVLIGIGAALLAWGVTMIPMALGAVVSFIGALWGMAVAAWAALAPILVAAAPFIAIGAAVAAVVFGLFMLVTHWKQVTEFLSKVWAAVWHAVVGFLQAAGKTIASIAKTIASTLASWVRALGSAIQAGFQFILWVVTLPIRLIAGLFVWLYNHNYYFKALVDAIITIFKIAWAFIQAVWKTIILFLVNTWKGLQAEAKAAWLLFKLLVITPIQDLWATIQWIWNTAFAWLKALFAVIVTMAQTAWQNFVNSITGIISGVTTAVSSIVSSITTPITNLASAALDWGSNLIQSFINGMLSKLNDIKTAAGNIIGAVGSFLGFHSPAKEGPGAEADVWGPNLITMFANGLSNKQSLVRKNAQALASIVDDALGSGLQKKLSLNPALTGGSSNAHLNGATLAQGQPSGTHIHGDINISVPVDATALDKDDTPENIGVRFGQSAAAQFTAALAQRGYRKT